MSLKRKFARLLGFELCDRCRQVVPRLTYKSLGGICVFCHYSECLGEAKILSRRYDEDDRDVGK